MSAGAELDNNKLVSRKTQCHTKGGGGIFGKSRVKKSLDSVTDRASLRSGRKKAVLSAHTNGGLIR